MKVIHFRFSIKLLIVIGLGSNFSFAQSPEEDLDNLGQVESSERADDPALSDEQNVISNQDIELEPSPQNIFDPVLLTQINIKEQQLLEVLKTEDAFSLKLAEVYSEYGALLSRSGRFDEANEVYRQALHIEKVNGGIYAQEQLYALNALAEISIATEQEEDLNTYLSRAFLISNNNQDLNNPHLNEMYIKAGKYYLDLYGGIRSNYRAGIEYLQKSRQFFEYVLARYRDRPLSEYSLPYRELVFISYLEGSIISGLPLSANSVSGSQSNLPLSEQTRILEARRQYAYLSGSYDRGMEHLNEYLQKARREDNGVEKVKAFLAAGDLSLLFREDSFATDFYKSAWINIEKYNLQDQYLAMLTTPQIIPPFDYLSASFKPVNSSELIVVGENEPQDSENLLSVPLSFSLNRYGEILNIKAADEAQSRYFARARRVLRRLAFRPAIIDGDRVTLEEFTYPIELVVN